MATCKPCRNRYTLAMDAVMLITLSLGVPVFEDIAWRLGVVLFISILIKNILSVMDWLEMFFMSCEKLLEEFLVPALNFQVTPLTRLPSD